MPLKDSLIFKLLRYKMKIDVVQKKKKTKKKKRLKTQRNALVTIARNTCLPLLKSLYNTRQSTLEPRMATLASKGSKQTELCATLKSQQKSSWLKNPSIWSTYFNLRKATLNRK